MYIPNKQLLQQGHLSAPIIRNQKHEVSRQPVITDSPTVLPVIKMLKTEHMHIMPLDTITPQTTPVIQIVNAHLGTHMDHKLV